MILDHSYSKDFPLKDVDENKDVKDKLIKRVTGKLKHWMAN